MSYSVVSVGTLWNDSKKRGRESRKAKYINQINKINSRFSTYRIISTRGRNSKSFGVTRAQIFPTKNSR